MVDRMLQMGDWLKGNEEKGKEALPHERVARFVGFFAGKLRDTTNTVVDKVMEMPNNFAGRWMVVNVAFGMAFHLLPIAFMFFLRAVRLRSYGIFLGIFEGRQLSSAPDLIPMT